MALLTQKDRQYVEHLFSEMTRPVKLVVFTQKTECQYCKETREIVEELSGLSPNVSHEVFDFVEDEVEVERYQILQIPAIAILEDGEEPVDYGIRYYGIPSGYEFSSLLEDISMVGTGESGLSDETKHALREIDEPVHLQVFVTPTCPYCPKAVHMAHQIAYENKNVRADMVEAIEFPHLANRYNVRGVPRTVINEDVHVEGAVPEQVLLHRVLEAVGQEHVH